MLMPILLCTGNIPLLLGHLSLTATSLCWPARGIAEAQGDEKVDRGDEEAWKGENFFEKKKHLKWWAAGALCDADPAQVAATAEGDDGDEGEEDVGDEGEEDGGIEGEENYVNKGN